MSFCPAKTYSSTVDLVFYAEFLSYMYFHYSHAHRRSDSSSSEIISDKKIDTLTPEERTSLVFLTDNKLVTFLHNTLTRLIRKKIHRRPATGNISDTGFDPWGTSQPWYMSLYIATRVCIKFP